jgi:hypothetical protein
MLGDSELERQRATSSQSNRVSALISGAKSANFLSFNATPDMESEQNGMDAMLNPDTSGLDTDSMVNRVVGGFANAMSGMGGSFGLKIDNSDIKGNGPGGGLIPQLVQLILDVVELPMRFGYLFISMMEGSAALAVGVGGIVQSTALATKDLGILIVAILNIVFKYFLCIMSFIITTIGGCFIIHIFSLFFVMIYLFVMFIVDLVNETVGLDMTPLVDHLIQYIRWPEPIGTICYTCFGKPVKLRDIISDVGVLEDIGNMISYDFTNSMPRYMSPAIPIGNDAMKNLDKAIN